MGSRNPDRRPFAVHATGVNTVVDMQRAGWRVHSQCPACGVKLKVSLEAVRRVLGPTAELWDRHPDCQRVGCIAKVTYWGQPPAFNMAMPLTAAERYRKDGM